MTRLIQGDALTRLRELPAASVDCCVTSPPYWGLRDYGAPGQIGLENTPGEWVARLAAVFGAVRRVLKPTGTLWLNCGDKHLSDGGSGHQGNANSCRAHRRHTQKTLRTAAPETFGLKPKDLCLLPERLAIALQADGWWVRQRCIWHKLAPMPESAKDRPTTDFEFVWMLTPARKYFFDWFAVREETETGARNLRAVWRLRAQPFVDEMCRECGAYYDAREKRALERTGDDRLICKCGRADRWLAHFATFPPSLPDLCIRASTPEMGCCASCGRPVERLVRRVKVGDWHPETTVKNAATTGRDHRYGRKWRLNANVARAREAGGAHDHPFPALQHAGWRRCCAMSGKTATVAGVVLDPFAGAGTTLLAAERLGRNAIGIELSRDYCALAEARLRRDRARRTRCTLEACATGEESAA